MKKPNIIVEIGTAKGSLYMLSQVAKNAILISTDLPSGKFGGGYEKWKTKLFKSFIEKEQGFYLIRGDSYKVSTVEKLKNILSDCKIDFIFIDEDYTYGGKKRF